MFGSHKRIQLEYRHVGRVVQDKHSTKLILFENQLPFFFIYALLQTLSVAWLQKYVTHNFLIFGSWSLKRRKSGQKGGWPSNDTKMNQSKDIE